MLAATEEAVEQKETDLRALLETATEEDDFEAAEVLNDLIDKLTNLRRAQGPQVRTTPTPMSCPALLP